MITAPELRHLVLHAILASAGAHLVRLEDYGLGVCCFVAQFMVEWVLRDARRAARLRALDEFDTALHERVQTFMDEWYRSKQSERTVLVMEELTEKGRYN